MAVTELRRDGARYGSFSCAGGAVDGDHELFHWAGRAGRAGRAAHPGQIEPARECNMRIMRRWSIATVVVVVTLAGGVFIARPFVHGLSFVIRAAEMDGTLRRVADLDASAEREREIAIPTPGGSMRGRVYEPIGAPHRAALLVSGLHSSGIDEPRLMRLARQLAADHLVVVTPDIPELSRFE